MEEKKGFTLVEMLIVVVILGVLAAIAIPRITSGSKAAKNNACKTNIELMNRQIELYHAMTDSWPQTLADVTENPDYFPDGPPECPFGWVYRMRRLGMAGNTYRVIEHNHTGGAQRWWQLLGF